MKLKVFSVRDDKAEIYMRPFFAQTIAEACRMWKDAASDENTSFFRHPEDFCLFEVGDFDTEFGTLIPALSPKPLGKAFDFIEKKPLPLRELNA